MVKKQNCLTWIRVSLYTQKQMIFIKILQNMLKLGLIFQIMNQIDHCLKGKIKKVVGLMKNELGGELIKRFVGQRSKTYNYLIGDCSEGKEQKTQKVCRMS